MSEKPGDTRVQIYTSVKQTCLHQGQTKQVSQARIRMDKVTSKT